MANNHKKHNSPNMNNLTHKLHIKGKITVETGLHIGGTEVELDIGGLDNEVIKIKQGDKRVPYIPGSSLKGKMRALLGRYYGKSEPKHDVNPVAHLFGIAPWKEYKTDKDGKRYTIEHHTRSQLIVRDSYAAEPEKIKTEDKAENTIDRVSGDAKPRHMERVVNGAVFNLDMILDIYKNSDEKKLLQTLDLAFQLLRRDYLGGSGTRGNGKVDISGLYVRKIEFKETGEVKISDHDFNFKTNKKRNENSTDTAPAI